MDASCHRPRGGVAIGHARVDSYPWPKGWENIRGSFHAYLKTRVRARATRNPLFHEARGIAERLGVPPELVGQSQWEALEGPLKIAKGLRGKMARMSLSHLAAFLGGRSLWNRAFLPSWIRTEVVVDNLSPDWQYQLRTLNDVFEARGVTPQVRLRWMRALTIFVWLRDFPEKGKLDLTAVENGWNEMLAAPPPFLGYAKIPSGKTHLGRAFTALRNYWIETGRGEGDRREVNLVDSGFWRPVNSDIRAAAHKLFPLPWGPPRSSIREGMVRYVLLRVLKFDSALPARRLEIKKEEAAQAIERLRGETWSEPVILQAMEDMARVLTLARSMSRQVIGSLI